MNKTLLILEIIGFIQVPLVWYLFKKFFKRNMFGEMLAAMIIGVFFEMATEPLWDYHFKITFYRDIPIAVVTGWMVMLSAITVLSEKFYKILLKKPALLPYDKRIFLFDVITAMFVALPMEAIGAKYGVWTYNNGILGWDWGIIPFFNLPWEIMLGYSLLMLIAPTFIRYWQSDFEGNGK